MGLVVNSNYNWNAPDLDIKVTGNEVKTTPVDDLVRVIFNDPNYLPLTADFVRDRDFDSFLSLQAELPENDAWIIDRVYFQNTTDGLSQKIILSNLGNEQAKDVIIQIEGQDNFKIIDYDCPEILSSEQISKESGKKYIITKPILSENLPCEIIINSVGESGIKEIIATAKDTVPAQWPEDLVNYYSNLAFFLSILGYVLTSFIVISIGVFVYRTFFRKKSKIESKPTDEPTEEPTEELPPNPFLTISLLENTYYNGDTIKAKISFSGLHIGETIWMGVFDPTENEIGSKRLEVKEETGEQDLELIVVKNWKHEGTYTVKIDTQFGPESSTTFEYLSRSETNPHISNKKEHDEIFEEADLEDKIKQEKESDINKKSRNIILPIFDEFSKYFQEKGMVVKKDNDFRLNVKRNNTWFFIECAIGKEDVTFSYLFEGGGVMPTKTFTSETITQETISQVFRDFSEYIVKWS